jgi:hypothetical protein
MIEIGELVERASDGVVLDVLRVIERPDGTRTYVCRSYPFGTDEVTYTGDEVRPHRIAKYG